MKYTYYVETRFLTTLGIQISEYLNYEIITHSRRLQLLVIIICNNRSTPTFRYKQYFHRGLQRKLRSVGKKKKKNVLDELPGLSGA